MNTFSEGDIFDVIIVGGGPAGLSAALVLGRSLRKVLVCDAGNPRNAAARVFIGFLSRDGCDPAEYRKACRDQLRRYETVELRDVKVIDVDRHKKGFAVTLANGARERARTLLLATGLIDELPKIEGLAQFYGATVHSCPFCDGWESRDQPIAVTGTDHQCAADLAIELRLWSTDVILCSNGPSRCNRKARAQMQRAGISVIETPIAALEGEGEKLSGIRFADDSFLHRTAFFFSPEQQQRSSLAEKLGCKFSRKDHCIQCADDTSTGVPGLYAAGNASRGIQLVIAAAAEGTLAAVAINNALLETDAKNGRWLRNPQ